jgi:hypothetical protein
MKQTAVEWLENEFQEIFKEWGGLDTHWIKRFEQAKAMEKEQMEDSYCFGILDSGEDGLGFNHYYNKTFKL